MSCIESNCWGRLLDVTVWHGEHYERNLERLLSEVLFSCSVVSDSLWPHETQHARPPCPSPTPGVQSNSCPLSQWCHPAISSSDIPFFSCPQSLPASESFPMSQLFTWGGQHLLDHQKSKSSRKISTSALLTMPKPLTVWVTINYGKFFKIWECQTTWPASWEICMQVRKQPLKLDMDNRLVPDQERSTSRLYCVTLLI